MTPRQKELLDFIKRYQHDHQGVSPTFIEMREGIGMKSKSGVSRVLQSLEEQGFIRRLHKRHRAIEIIDRSASTLALRQYSNSELMREAERRGLVLGRILNFPDGKRAFAKING